MQLPPLGTAMPKTEALERTVAPENQPAAPVAVPDVPHAALQQDAASQRGELTNAVATINKAVQALAPSLEFSIDADSKRTIVKIVDQDTKEVIRQMPTVEALEIAKALDRLQGLLIRQTA